jgi:PAS domain S-box-containing protein
MASLSVLLALVSNGAGDLVCLAFFFIGSFLLLPTVYSLLKWRISSIDANPVQNLKWETDIEIKMRLLFLRRYENDTDGVIEEVEKEIVDGFQVHSKNIKGSFKFNQVWATYLFAHRRNRLYAMTKLRQILTQSPLFFDIIPVHIRLRYMSSYSNGENSDEDLWSYEEQVRLERTSIESMTKCLSVQLRFWGALVSEEYNLEKMERFTREISRFTEVSRNSLQRMIILNPKSMFYRRLYSQFLLNIANDDTSAKRQLTRAMELESEEEDNYSLTDSSNCIIIISGERDNLGQILEANNRTCEVFGVSSEDIIGRKVNLLMAKPYAAMHNTGILNYIHNKHINLNDTSKELVLKSSNGVSFEGILQIREYPNFTLDPSIAFFGAIKPMKERTFCVVKISDLIICEASLQFLSFFTLDLQKVKNLEYNLLRILPSFEDRLVEISKALGGQSEYVFLANAAYLDKNAELQVYVSFLPYLPNKDYYMIVIKNDVDHIDSVGFWDDKHNMSDEPTRKNPKTKVKGEKKVFVRDGSFSSSSGSGDEMDMGSSESGEAEGIENVEQNQVSGTKGLRSTNLLRLGLTRQSELLEPRLRALFSCTIALLFILCGMGIAVQLLWSGMTISRYEASIDLLTIPLRSGTTIGSYSANMFEHLFRRSFYTTNEDIHREDQRLRRVLTTVRSKMTALRTIVFNARKGLTLEELDRITKSEFELVDYRGNPRRVNLLEAVHLYNSAITTVLNYNLTQLEQDKRYLHFLEANRDANIPSVWNDACQHILDTQRDSAQRVQLIEFAFMVVAISLVSFVLLTIYLPSIYYAAKQKSEVFRLFEKMDIGNLKDTISQCKSRLCEFEGVEQSNNIDIQDALEDSSSKTKKAKVPDGKGVPEKAKSKVNVGMYRIMFTREIGSLLILLIITSIYFAGYYVWWLNERKNLFDDIDTRVYISRNRNWYCQKLAQQVVTWNEATQEITIDIEEAEKWEQQIWDVNRALYYGDSAWNITTDIRVLEGGERLFSGDVCSQLRDNHVELYSDIPCEDFYDSVMTRGAYETYISYISLSQHVRKTYKKNGINSTLSEIRLLKEFADNWLPNVGRLFDDWLTVVFRNGFMSASSVRSIGTVIYVIICFIMGGFVFYPMVRRLNNEIQITRNLLTIIPCETLESSEPLREAVRSIAVRLLQNQ